jgi:pyruvate/2-oxoglutarate dehydrogenase complex dihydrolipoamide acyltransferase (E2) component
MAEQEPAPFDKESFKAALIAQINQIAPNTIDDADKFKSSGATGQLKAAVAGEVEAGKSGAEAPIAETVEAEPDTGAVEPKPVVPQPPTEAGPRPPDLGASAAAPKPKSAEEVSLDAGPQSIAEKMAEAKVTDDTLANSNEPEFVGALDAKSEAKEHAETAPAAYRGDEAAVIGNAEAEAAGTAQAKTGEMYETRTGAFSNVSTEQDSTRTGDERHARDHYP